MATRILLADDHPVVRQGVRALLERQGLHVVAEAGDGRRAVQLAAECRADVAVLDVSMPHMNGLDAAREVRRASPSTSVVLLTVHADDHYVLEALRAGVQGYVLKDQAPEDLVEAVLEVARGATYLSPGIARVVVQAYLDKKDLPSDPLSPREREVLQLVAEGKTTKEVAQILGVSVKTADSHRSRLMEKLDIHETATLVRYAIRRGLVQA
jgi:two-component system response regulator NreC